MDEKLSELLRIQPLLTEVVAYRGSSKICARFLKEACKSEMENLCKVEISIEETELKLPDENKWPVPSNIEFHTVDIDKTLQNYDKTITALNMLK